MLFLPAKIELGILKISQLEVNSAVTIGGAHLLSRRVKNKRNQGFGQQMADCSLISIPISFVIDDDIIDKSIFIANQSV